MASSQAYEKELPSQLHCWTSCLVRESAYDYKARNATSELLEKWLRLGLPAVPEAESKLTTCTHCNLVAVMIPEAHPNMIGPVTKVIDLVLLADDINEGTDEELIADSMAKLSSNSLTRTDLMGEIAAEVGQDLLTADAKLGYDLLHEIRNYWYLHRTFAQDIHRHSQTWQSYMPYRYCNFAAPIIEPMIAFGGYLTLTDEDRRLNRVPIFASAIAAILWNDMYSWPKEANDYASNCSAYPINSVAVLMREHSCSSKEALQKCRRLILQYELKCQNSIKAVVNDPDSTLSSAGKTLALGCASFIAGNALWACVSERFQTPDVSEYQVLQSVTSTPLPSVKLDEQFESDFTNLLTTCQTLVSKRWERSARQF